MNTELILAKLSYDPAKQKWFIDGRKMSGGLMGQVSEDLLLFLYQPRKNPKTIDVEYERTDEHPITRIRYAGKPFIERKPVDPIVETSTNDKPAESDLSVTISDHTANKSDNSGTQQMNSHFHNPYNFIPALPRNIDHPDLGDQTPASHDRYHSELWSGRIKVKLTTHTPLLIPDASKATENKDTKHKTYPTRVDSQGNPYLPSTSIKGMLRAAYEAVTNSRMGVFVKHGEPLAYRLPAQRKTMGAPARIEIHDDQLTIHFMNSVSLKSYMSHEDIQSNKDLKPESRKIKGADIIVNERKYTPGKLPNNEQEVWVKLSGSYVIDWLPVEQNRPSQEWVKGWACITGPNIRDKKSERIFIEDKSKTVIILTGPEKKQIEELWANLIDNYQKEHKRDIRKRRDKEEQPADYLGDAPGKTGWSYHIYSEKAKQISNNTLCYVEVDGQNPQKVTAIFPVSISRRLYQTSPEDLLDKSVRPATKYSGLSPADRVFGWVNQKNEGHLSAYRGKIQIGHALCITPDPLEKFDNNGKQGIPLAILAQPKTQQSRFYVAKTVQKGEKQDDHISLKKAGYIIANPPKGLRGRKVYPHHAGTLIAKDYWKNPLEDRTQKGIETPYGTHFQEYRRPHKGDPENNVWLIPKYNSVSFKTISDKEQLDDQNRSIRSWVKKETQFIFNINVTNISKFELGALLWLLSLNSDEFPPNLFHRLGGGKPLGFGSVTLEAVWQDTSLWQGKECESQYSSFDNEYLVNQIFDNGEDLVANFKKITKECNSADSFEKVRYISAFLACAEGFNSPIHYPRARPKPNQWKSGSALPPHPEGRAYEWFVQNEDVNFQKAFALPDLCYQKTEGLPILDIEESKKHGRGNSNRRNRK